MSDRLALANAIEDAGIPRDKAQRVASVIFDAIGRRTDDTRIGPCGGHGTARKWMPRHDELTGQTPPCRTRGTTRRRPPPRLSL